MSLKQVTKCLMENLEGNRGNLQTDSPQKTAAVPRTSHHTLYEK